jgi:hypothetical protein
MPRLKHTLIGVCAILLTLQSLSAIGAKLYRWVDDEGNVQFSDKVPPEHAHRERSRLNERGLEVERVDRAQTKEEVAQEKELERLRAEKERLIKEQQARDQVLLRTFRSEDDILMARDGKLASIDVQIKVGQDAIKRLKQRLADMQKNAATQERQNGFVSKRLQQDIEKTRIQMEDNYAAILNKERSKQQITEKHDEDIGRFRILKKLSPRKEEKDTQEDQHATLLDNVVGCADASTCDAAWAKAKEYALKHATTKLEMESSTIIMTAAPTRDHEYSITVSRIRDQERTGAEIFLDLQCRETAKGRDLCQGEKTGAIRQGFHNALSGTE